jgi:hypothetical protein
MHYISLSSQMASFYNNHSEKHIHLQAKLDKPKSLEDIARHVCCMWYAMFLPNNAAISTEKYKVECTICSLRQEHDTNAGLDMLFCLF